MDTRDAQELMRKIYFDRDRARGVERTLLRTFHELGELSDAILRGLGQSHVESEVADVFAWLCSLANLLDVDLSEALDRKYGDGCSRCKKTPCECTEAP
jgi:NTP pyrophosphatase (non-canonical NTP hydrolase)